jgi:ABC-2 type transport system permease protein
MNAFFGGTWAGMAMITDLDRNVVSRFLATPASRLSIVLSQVVRSGLTAAIQALIILLVGLALGVRVHGGAAAWVVVLVLGALVSMVFAGISNGIALLVRREATMIAAANFVGLPLMFLSSILIQQRVMPNWMSEVSRFNPVNWGVRAARDAVVVGGHWGAIGVYTLLLIGLTAVTSLFATWTFRVYQRSL